MDSREEKLRLEVLHDAYAICRLDPREPVPLWCLPGALTSLTYTQDELSIVCLEDLIPKTVTAEFGWMALRVLGPLDFSLTGILASLAVPLAAAGVSIFALSTYDTDYILVPQRSLTEARRVLSQDFHFIN